jgi:hypothetical protein
MAGLCNFVKHITLSVIPQMHNDRLLPNSRLEMLNFDIYTGIRIWARPRFLPNLGRIFCSALVNCFWHVYTNPRCGEVYTMGGIRYSHCSMTEAVRCCEEICGKKMRV